MKFGVDLGPFSMCCGTESHSRLSVSMALRPPFSREGADEGGVDGDLRSVPKRESASQYLYGPGVGRGVGEVHGSEPGIEVDTGPCFATHASDSPLQGDGTDPEMPGGRACRAVVTQGVQHASATASGRVEGEGKAQTAAQEGVEMFVGEGIFG